LFAARFTSDILSTLLLESSLRETLRKIVQFIQVLKSIGYQYALKVDEIYLLH